jgi:DNA polymerase-3 subunit beta
MNVLVSRNKLLRLLVRCAAIADKKGTVPALANVLLETTDGGLRASATDLALGFVGTAGASVKKPGSIAVEARQCLERVKAMPDGDVALTTEGSTLTIKAAEGNRRFRIAGMPGADMPTMPAAPADATELSFGVGDLLALITATSYAISTDETRLHLNSAMFEANAGKLRMVSTNGHRLALRELAYDGPGFESMLLPLKGVLELKRLLDETDAETVTLRQSGYQLFASIGGDVFSLRLCDLEPVPWAQVVPKSHEARVTIGADAISGALRAVRVAASDRTGIVKLSLSAGKLRIETESPESGEGFDEIAVDYDGPERSLGANANYLLEAIGSVAGDEVAFEVSGELDPIAIRAAAEDGGLAIVMPARV